MMDLQVLSSRKTLEWACNCFSGSIALSSSFQTQSLPLLHLVAEFTPHLPILFIDTGYHFPETITFRDHLVGLFNLNLRVIKPLSESLQGLDDGGEALYRVNPDLCCDIRKVLPVQAAMKSYHAWISGIRRDQSRVRSDADVVEKTVDGVTRIHPMLDWSQDDVQQYIVEHALPRHPLDAFGYTSIGCKPCTRPPLVAGDLRSGRWQGGDKTECGLHTRLRSPKMRGET